MPTFSCQVCNSSFSVSQSAIDKFAGWTPKYCREHSPKKKAKKASGRGGGGGRKRASREENLTRAEVLAKYTGGPQSGVFTDGSSVPNPGPGGWGVVWVDDGEIVAESYGQDPHTTNNRMELKALIEAFRLLPEDSRAVVHTDSKLCVNTIESWAPKWESNGWTKKTGDIKNLELVKELLALRRSRPACALQWIAAHSGNRWNEYADSLASAWQREDL
jgi:ribonuclease HI